MGCVLNNTRQGLSVQPRLAWISHSSTHFFLPRREEPKGTLPGPAVFFLCPCSGKACPQKQHALLTGEKQLSFEVLHFVKCMPSSEERVIPGESSSLPSMEKDNPNLRPIECSPCDLNATEETSKNNALFHPQGEPVEYK